VLRHESWHEAAVNTRDLNIKKSFRPFRYLKDIAKVTKIDRTCPWNLETLWRAGKLGKVQRQPRGTPTDTDGESMIPESHRSSGSALDGLRVDSDLIRVDPDAICATLDMMSGCRVICYSYCRSPAGDAERQQVKLRSRAESQGAGSSGRLCHPKGSSRKARLTCTGLRCEWSSASVQMELTTSCT
jgi:hypothetical protein